MTPIVEEIMKLVEDFLITAKKTEILKDFKLVYAEPPSRELYDVRFGEALQQFTSKAIELQAKLPVKDNIIEENLKPKLDEKVLIRVDCKEINRRISAFISRKRKVADERNAIDFCGSPLVDEDACLDQINSCARIDAAYVRSASKDNVHIKVSKVENRWGPQTHLVNSTCQYIKQDMNPGNDDKIQFTSGIEERLKNMESHLKLKSGNCVPGNIYSRLKQLEDRILYLEGLSPDYFHFYNMGSNYGTSESKERTRREKYFSNWSIAEIENRMQSLRDALKYRSQTKKMDMSE